MPVTYTQTLFKPPPESTVTGPGGGPNLAVVRRKKARTSTHLSIATVSYPDELDVQPFRAKKQVPRRPVSSSSSRNHLSFLLSTRGAVGLRAVSYKSSPVKSSMWS